jgi:hypothetical protein
VVVGAGAAYALVTWPAGQPLPLAFHPPALPARWPTPAEFAQGALLLALPQLALSLGNSVLATQQVVRDLFPQRAPLTVRTIGTTYALMNLAAVPLGGARTGGSVVLYGGFLMLAGLFLVGDPAAFQRLFPAPVLGTLLLVEAAAVLWLVRDQLAQPRALALALACGGAAAWLPYGYAVALVAGTLVWRLAFAR